MSSQVRPPSTEPFFRKKRELKKRDSRGWPVGPRTERRIKENRVLNALPDSIKNFCELRLPGCLKNKMLSWAHSKKSRFLLTSKDWQEACRACFYCHSLIEAMSHAEMHRLVNEAIKKRKLPQ